MTTDFQALCILINRRELTINIIKTIYLSLSGKNLPIYGVHNRYLKDFVTTKGDIKRKKFKIPEEQYRLREEDKKIEKDKDLGQGEIINVKDSKNLY